MLDTAGKARHDWLTSAQRASRISVNTLDIAADVYGIGKNEQLIGESFACQCDAASAFP